MTVAPERANTGKEHGCRVFDGYLVKRARDEDKTERRNGQGERKKRGE